jgi:hypothetical protein
MHWTEFPILLSGIAWTITYVALVYRGFKDKSYGMPLVPLALNFAWETTFSIIYPPQDSNGIITAINTVWMVCDIGIITTYFLYGFKYFKKNYQLTYSTWFIITLIAFIISFGIMITGGNFLAQFELYFRNSIFEGAKFIAFIQNLIISICFILMYWERQSSEGQSFTIAWTKWLGTSMTVGLYYLFIDHKGESTSLMAIFIISTFLLDTYYMQLIYRHLKAEGINPWTRL